MAILYRHYDPDVQGGPRRIAPKAGIPNTWKDEVSFGASQDTVKLLPFHSSKGLEYPIVVIPGAGLLPKPDEATEEDAQPALRGDDAGDIATDCDRGSQRLRGGRRGLVEFVAQAMRKVGADDTAIQSVGEGIHSDPIGTQMRTAIPSTLVAPLLPL
jgi:hypothetical protein